MDGENGSTNGAESPGAGGGSGKVLSPIGDAGIPEIKEQRIVARAIRGKWTGDKRWNTDATSEDLQRRFAEAQGKLTLKEQAVLATMKGVQSDNDRARGIAVRNLLTMEAQNQADELKQLPDVHLNIHRMAEDEKKDRLGEIIAAARKRAVDAQAAPVASANGSAGLETHATNGHAPETSEGP